MNNITMECFECRKDIKTPLVNKRIKAKHEFKCPFCQTKYKGTQFLNGKARVTRTNWSVDNVNNN